MKDARVSTHTKCCITKVSSTDVCVLIEKYYATATCFSHSLTFGNKSVTPNLHQVHNSICLSVSLPIMKYSFGVKLPMLLGFYGVKQLFKSLHWFMKVVQYYKSFHLSCGTRFSVKKYFSYKERLAAQGRQISKAHVGNQNKFIPVS